MDLLRCGTTLIMMTSWISVAYSHSWITCTDYIEDNGAIWNASLCRAFPRHGWEFTSRTLQHGRDTGYDHRPTESRPCRTEIDIQGGYDSQHPFAVYYPGQKVVITHPAKGHAADTRCTGKNIRDTGNMIYRSDLNATADPTLSGFRNNVVSDLGQSPFGSNFDEEAFTTYPKLGFHNSPNYCQNQDKALATNSFNVPFMQPGYYIFMWEWAFNSENDLYSSCWDVQVVPTRGHRDSVLQQRALPLTDLGSITTTSKTTTQTTTETTSTTATRSNLEYNNCTRCSPGILVFIFGIFIFITKPLQ